MRARLAASLLLGVLLGACDLFTGPTHRLVGVIGVETTAESALLSEPAAGAGGCEWLEESTVWEECILDAPDTVTVGEAFDVVVRTIPISRPCVEAGGATVSRSGLLLEITPYDTWDGESVCPNWIRTEPLSRTVTLLFSEPGDATIRVTARILILGSGEAQEERPASVEHSLTILP